MDSVLKTFDEKLRAARSVAIFAHKNPDGDALCSVLALARLIEMNYGRRPLCVYDGNIPDALDNVPDRNRIQFYSRIDMARPFDVAIVLDYGTARNIGGPMPVLENAKYTIEIDHHINDAHVAELCIDDDSAAATGVIIYQIMRALGWQSDADVASLIALAILTDTGFFKYVRPGNGVVLNIMADLVNDGVNIAELADGMNNKPRRAIQTEAAVVANAEFLFHGHLALATVEKKDYKHLDGRGELILGLLAQIKGVEYVALLKQQKENQIGVSLRGRMRPVDHIAAALGGGGHTYAAGAVVNDTLENVHSRIVELFKGEKL